MIIGLYVYSSCHLIVGDFARQMHSTTEFATTVLSKCECVCVCVSNTGIDVKLLTVVLPAFNLMFLLFGFEFHSRGCRRH